MIRTIKDSISRGKKAARGKNVSRGKKISRGKFGVRRHPHDCIDALSVDQEEIGTGEDVKGE